ncbi:MAG: mevalonate kinase [Deltaproteobacteria bacterium]|nr:MAG: mevalonate kinase [Deltaproteobacteria bacterium]
MRSGSRSFNSKLLLFGEYSVIKNSMALSIPYPLFDGALSFRKDQSKVVDQELKALSLYLKNIKNKGDLSFDFDVQSFEFDIGQGLYFDSTIPQGFGVGSSGALCAALFDRYSKNCEGSEIKDLKVFFSQMEGHFHGSSSGMDPLISYLNRPILRHQSGQIGTVDLPNFKDGKGGLFLLNTGRARRTEPLVNLFLEKCKTTEFNSKIENDLKNITDECITHFLEGQVDDLYKSFSRLSEFQYRELSPMIPNLFQEVWKSGLENCLFKLKLCGAGGGGFLLGMTPNFEEAASTLSSYEIRPLIRF